VFEIVVMNLDINGSLLTQFSVKRKHRKSAGNTKFLVTISSPIPTSLYCMLIAQCPPLSGLKQISCPAKTFELVLCYRFTSYCSWNVKGGKGGEGGGIARIKVRGQAIRKE
jgi:hypothetical protein